MDVVNLQPALVRGNVTQLATEPGSPKDLVAHCARYLAERNPSVIVKLAAASPAISRDTFVAEPDYLVPLLEREFLKIRNEAVPVSFTTNESMPREDRSRHTLRDLNVVFNLTLIMCQERGRDCSK